MYVKYCFKGIFLLIFACEWVNVTYLHVYVWKKLYMSGSACGCVCVSLRVCVCESMRSKGSLITGCELEAVFVGRVNY